jgi:hypothetical protein
VFVGNQSVACQPSNPTANSGGGIYSTGAAGSTASMTLINCLFTGNKGGVGCGGSGGAIYNTSFSTLILTNCTLSGNTADNDGGGIAVISGSVMLGNCILWDNSDSGGAGRSAQIHGSVSVEYSCIQGGWCGTGNIDSEPIFLDASGDDGIAGTLDDNLRLAAGSPCIDAGDNTGPISSILVDLDGNPRFIDDPNTLNSGFPPSTEAIVDMGAYEYQEPCEDDTDCDDGRPCTDDRCDDVTGQCIYREIICSDGLFCNGQEVCIDGICRSGKSPDCDDGVSCTVDTCDESTDSCKNSPIDAFCDNQTYCDGAEICHPMLGCLEGNDPCSGRMCEEDADTCVDCLADVHCDNGEFCDGAETCVSGTCQSGDNPCPARMCDESQDSCADCLNDDDCDDQNRCTDDKCILGSCANSEYSDGTPCPDDLFCNGLETCLSGICVDGVSPCGIDEICNEDNDECNLPPDCQIDSECDDGNPCTDDMCSSGICEHVNNSSFCDDNDACTANDICSAGVCMGTPIPGCGESPVQPVDLDNDGVVNHRDLCPNTPAGEAVDTNGCSCSQLDDDDDGVDNCDDGCPLDPDKTKPGQCGCDTQDIDTDNDAIADCIDTCPEDPGKVEPGQCGCGNPDIDGDGDGTADCNDSCPGDPYKTVPGQCGCGNPDTDTDDDGAFDCHDMCPDDPAKTVVGLCGCGIADDDWDNDGVPACRDLCPGTVVGSKVDVEGCPVESPPAQSVPEGEGGNLQVEVELSTPVRRRPVCGVFGAINWTIMLFGLSCLRKRQVSVSRQ